MPKFTLERQIAIKAPAASVFSNVNDFRNWVDWSPWILAEPMCELDYAEDGSSYSWSGDIIGAGKMEVLDFVANQEIHYRLTFLTPFKSVSSVSFYFDESNGKTNTRWTMSGSLPFFLFWMKKMMVAAISMDYDRGLRMLKDRIELGAIPSKLKFAGFESVAGCEYVGLSRDCSLSEISDFMVSDMEKASRILKESGTEVVGEPLCLYEKFNLRKGTTRFRIALPVPAGSSCPKGLTKRKMTSQKAYAIHHTGAYRHLGNAWAAGMMHQRAKLFAARKKRPPFELYRNDPCKVTEDELLTSVYFPAK